MRMYYTKEMQDTNGKYIACCLADSDCREVVELFNREKTPFRERDVGLCHSFSVEGSCYRQSYTFYMFVDQWDHYLFSNMSNGVILLHAIQEHFNIPDKAVGHDRGYYYRNIIERPFEIMYSIPGGHRYWRYINPSEVITAENPTREDELFWAYYSSSNKKLKDATQKEKEDMIRTYMQVKTGSPYFGKIKTQGLKRMWNVKF